MSSAPDASDAGRIAATAALDGLQGEAPELVVVYASNKYDLPALVRSTR
jgi:hypothetical protein